MPTRRVIKVGSRGSALALRQDEEVLALIRPLYPDLDFQVVTVRTYGDRNSNASLSEMGLGVFVREIERELLDGLLDMAIHSLKDLPTELPQGLTLGAVVRRQDARDALVNRWGCALADLPEGARIGTSSPRRQALLRNLCPQVVPVPIRGSVETRLRKSQGEECDGAILAAAGLARLGLTQHIAAYLSPQQFVPPPGQGALAVEVRADDHRMLELLRPLDHAETRPAVTAERAFLASLGGGCQLPVGAYARAAGESLSMTVVLSSPDGRRAFWAEQQGKTNDPERLAVDTYEALAEKGAGELLEAERAATRKPGAGG